MIRHVVWDWNGTLLDDFELVVAAASAACRLAEGPELSADDYRRHFVRPVQVFYQRLLGRPVDDAEWERLNERFHQTYGTLVASARLRPEVDEALAATHERGWTQSLLSMWDHRELLPLVGRFAVGRWFVRVDGQPGRGGGGKVEHLHRHLAALGAELGPLPPDEALVVGDSVDDAQAAAAAGCPCVLLGDGPHRREELEACGVPVVESLLEALDVADAIG